MASLAGLIFGYNVFKIGLLILPFMLVLFIFAVAMGIFMTAIILRFGPSAEWLGWPIPFAMSVFVGVFYPISTLPPALQLVSKIIPASYVFDSLRKLTTGVPDPNLLANLLIGTLLAIIYLAVMYIFLIMIYRRNLRNGQLSRFSSE
jgi:ABC-2 type transport system permease protein